MKLSRKQRAYCGKMRLAYRRAAEAAISLIESGTSGVAEVSENTYVSVCFLRGGRRMELECVASSFVLSKRVRGCVVPRVDAADREALSRFVQRGPEEAMGNFGAASLEVLAAGVPGSVITLTAFSGRRRA